MSDRQQPENPATIGWLEAQAGIGPTHAERFAFWRQFSHLGAGAFSAAVAEMHRMIATRTGAPVTPKKRKAKGGSQRPITSILPPKSTNCLPPNCASSRPSAPRNGCWMKASRPTSASPSRPIFCAAHLEPDHDSAQHPINDCVLDQIVIFDTNYGEWNTRAPSLHNPQTTTTATADALERATPAYAASVLLQNRPAFDTMVDVAEDAAELDVSFNVVIGRALRAVCALSPTPTDLRDAALQLPEVRALVEAARDADWDGEPEDMFELRAALRGIGEGK